MTTVVICVNAVAADVTVTVVVVVVVAVVVARLEGRSSCTK